MLGLAWQLGLVPVGESALSRAIELNGTAVPLNHRAFLWGRILALHPELTEQILAGEARVPDSLDVLIEARAAELVAYQSERLATRYRALVQRAEAAEGAPGRLTRAVAEGYFRVLAYKDEYEVARLHAAAQHGEKPVFHMAPPLITGMDKATGRRRKIAIPGVVALPLFRLLRHGKHLRGTALDPFGWQEDRRLERRLIAQYEADLDHVLARVRPDNLDIAVELAELPLAIRGFGPVKRESAKAAEPKRAALLARLDAPPRAIAAE